MDGILHTSPPPVPNRTRIDAPTFQTITAAQVTALLDPPANARPPALAGVGFDEAVAAASDPDFRARSGGNGDEVSQEWHAWREAALARLDLDQVYGPWLTGRRRPGWLECRDPIHSTTGDTNPSAAVADGTSDAAHKADRGDIYSFITGECISVFDFLIAAGKATTFVEAARLVADASGVPLPKFEPEVEDAGTAGSAVSDKMVIVVNNRQPIDVITDAWQALSGENHRPTLYRRSSNIVRIKRTEASDLHIAALGPDDMAGMLYRVARWVKKTAKPGRPRKAAPPRKKVLLVDTPPPVYIGRDMLNFPAESLPMLEAVLRAPLFGASSKLITVNGYYPEDRLALTLDPNLIIPPVPEEPTTEEVAQARTLLLDERFVDFHFKSASDRAHAEAVLLLPFVRRLIRGPTLLHLVESPSPGSGKGLLCSAATLVATGEDCPARVLSRFNDEVRKMITAELFRAKPVILLDNINTDNGHKLTARPWRRP